MLPPGRPEYPDDCSPNCVGRQAGHRDARCWKSAAAPAGPPGHSRARGFAASPAWSRDRIWPPPLAATSPLPACGSWGSRSRSWQPPAGEFLISSSPATAWHWIDPAVGYQTAWRCCGPVATWPSVSAPTSCRPTATRSSARSRRSTTRSRRGPAGRLPNFPHPAGCRRCRACDRAQRAVRRRR